MRSPASSTDRPKTQKAPSSNGTPTRGQETLSPSDPWDILGPEELCQPAPPVEYLIEGILEKGELGVVFGSPGHLKSMLLMDATISIAAGIPWLPSGPSASDGLKVGKAAVLWVDADMGKHKCHSRFAAMVAARELQPSELDFHLVTLPMPPLHLLDADSIKILKTHIEQYNIKVVILDNLSRVTPHIEDNDSRMGDCMATLRMLSERYQMSVIVVHHDTKEARLGRGTRIANKMRGSGAIEDAAGYVLHVWRDDDIITVKPGKCRGAEVEEFSARFEYTHLPGDEKTLRTVSFYRENRKKPNESVDKRDVEDCIYELVKERDLINKGDLAKLLQKESRIGLSIARKHIDEVEESGRIESKPGRHNAKQYSVRKG